MKRHWFFSFISLQVLIATLVILGFWSLQDKFAGISALLGALIAIIPGLVFIPFFYLRGYGLNAKTILSGFYLAEGLKLFISVLLFTLAFQWGKLRALALFTSFIAIQLTYWLFAFFTKNNS